MTETRPIDPGLYRRVLGNYPTGVTVVTAIDEEGRPVGMAVGSFTSVSLDPPLVAFFPDKGSSSFPRIRSSHSFCVNVLAADQEDVCRAFAQRGGDKFAGISWRPAASGAPRLDGVAAWIDCDFDSVTDAGDHYLVMGRVRELDGAGDGLPLVFFQGGYGRFSPSSMVVYPEPDVIGHLRHADLARGEMERLAGEIGAECVATAAVEDQLVVIAGAGAPARGTPRTRVGQRSPFLPPLGALFLAGSDDGDPAVQSWIARAGDTLDEEQRGAPLTLLDRVRKRGYSLSLVDSVHTEFEHALDAYSQGDHSAGHLDRIRRLAVTVTDRFEPESIDPDAEYTVRLISAPVCDARGEVVLLLTLWGLPAPLTGQQISAHAERLKAAATQVSSAIGALPQG